MTIILTNTKNEKLTKLLQQKAKIEAELARAKNAHKTEARKLDSRRKIILGAALMKGISTNAVRSEVARSLIEKFASDRDKKLFESFDFSSENKGE